MDPDLVKGSEPLALPGERASLGLPGLARWVARSGFLNQGGNRQPAGPPRGDGRSRVGTVILSQHCGLLTGRAETEWELYG